MKSGKDKTIWVFTLVISVPNMESIRHAMFILSMNKSVTHRMTIL